MHPCTEKPLRRYIAELLTPVFCQHQERLRPADCDHGDTSSDAPLPHWEHLWIDMGGEG